MMTVSASNETFLDEPLLVTDDEVVALAVAVGRPWPVPLPTVPEDSFEELMRAVSRGRRSLAVRQLLTPSADHAFGALAARIGDLITEPLQHGPIYTAFASDKDLQPVDAPVQHFLGQNGGDRWLVDSVHGSGMHALAKAAASTCSELLTGVMNVAWHEGVDSEAICYCVVRADVSPRRMASVTKSGARLWEIIATDEGDESSLRERDAEATLDAAVRWVSLPSDDARQRTTSGT